ncbi:hypothetical protein [Exiguobacterium artemiae]|uniref:hypothetical protein n=1 Tax=Exiguobacterium artemiae TaxID=340145 RepID=UPI00047CCCA0|nr:hypothetical protein [Exiguobacterium sibiricum]
MAKAQGTIIITEADGSRVVVEARSGKVVGKVVGHKMLKSRNIRDRETKVDMTRSINRMKDDNRQAVYNSISR